MTQFILLVISHLFKIWLYSIHVLIAKKNTLYMYHCTIVVSKTKTYKLCYFYLDFWHSNVGHSRHWKRKDWSLVILSSNRVYVHSMRSCLLQFNIDSSIDYSLFSFSTYVLTSTSVIFLLWLLAADFHLVNISSLLAAIILFRNFRIYDSWL